jgi:hypothetical protein
MAEVDILTKILNDKTKLARQKIQETKNIRDNTNNPEYIRRLNEYIENLEKQIRILEIAINIESQKIGIQRVENQIRKKRQEIKDPKTPDNLKLQYQKKIEVDVLGLLNRTLEIQLKNFEKETERPHQIDDFRRIVINVPPIPEPPTPFKTALPKAIKKERKKKRIEEKDIEELKKLLENVFDYPLKKDEPPPSNTNRPPQGQGFHRYNPWIEFVKANRGRFRSLKELAREYHRKI